ncbi:hypothetical protein TKK_0004083 [Trichogramma kaykai]|uniref:VWFD domain-containing protein n=1 Tax=Trichogramma kaykai TaxID=54128 RepID=A0ABD2XL79_9HYME
MSSLLITQDSNIMMLEIGVDKLVVPESGPFDSVLKSKYIVSFNFLDGDWIDIVPNRTDYKPYRGGCGREHEFHGGASVTFAVTSCFLDQEFEDTFIQVKARKELPEFVASKQPCSVLGSVLIRVDDLLNGIVKELDDRDELGDKLKIPHLKDPISRSMKGLFSFNDDCGCGTSEEPESYVTLWVRLSYLTDSVVTEIDVPSKAACSHFYAQEQSNGAGPYELRELDPGDAPDSRAAPRRKRCTELECLCTEEQRAAMLLARDQKNCATECTDGVCPIPAKVCASEAKSCKDRQTETDACAATKATLTDKECGLAGRKKRKCGDGDGKAKIGLSDDERAALLAALRAGASGPGVYLDKTKPCPPVDKICCVPCPPVTCRIECPPAPCPSVCFME